MINMLTTFYEEWIFSSNICPNANNSLILWNLTSIYLIMEWSPNYLSNLWQPQCNSTPPCSTPIFFTNVVSHKASFFLYSFSCCHVLFFSHTASSKRSLLILTLLWTFSFHHQDSLHLGLKPLDSPNNFFTTFPISCVILSHISFVFLCNWSKLPYKILCWKILCFHPLNATNWS